MVISMLSPKFGLNCCGSKVVFASLSDSSVTGAAEHGPRSRTVSFTESTAERTGSHAHRLRAACCDARHTILHDSGLDPNSQKKPWESPADDFCCYNWASSSFTFEISLPTFGSGQFWSISGLHFALSFDLRCLKFTPHEPLFGRQFSGCLEGKWR